MPLEPFQHDVAQAILALPEAEGFALAGGGAMLAHDLVDRRTEDLDLFAPRPGSVLPLSIAAAAALESHGWSARIARSAETFVRLELVREPDGRVLVIDLAQDARMLDPVTATFGPVIAVDELAADKVLALFGRGQARDLVDVDALRLRYTDDELFRLAASKDPGFQVASLVSAIRAAAGRAEADFVQTGLDADDVVGLIARGRAWAAALAVEIDQEVAPGAPG